MNLVLEIDGRGIDPDSNRKARRLANLVAARIEAVIQVVHEIGQPDRVHVEHRRGIRIGTHLRRIAGDDQHVAEPDRRRSQQIAEHAEQIPIAAGIVRHRLDPHPLLDQHARQQRAHPALRARAIGNVDGVDAGNFEPSDVNQHPRRIDTARRNDLH